MFDSTTDFPTDNGYEPYLFLKGDGSGEAKYVIVLSGSSDEVEMEDNLEYHVAVVAVDKYGNEWRDEVPFESSDPITSNDTTLDTLAPKVCDPVCDISGEMSVSTNLIRLTGSLNGDCSQFTVTVNQADRPGGGHRAACAMDSWHP